MNEPYVPPTAEEIDRVARYWRRVKDLGCEHSTLTFRQGDRLACDECGHPVRVLSDIQIEQMRGAP